MSTIDQVARKAVQGILDDLTDRRGLRQEWEGFDDEIQDEILETWEKLIAKAIRALDKDGP